VRILREGGYPEAGGPLAAALSDSDDRVTLEAIAAERALFASPPIARRKKVGFVVEVRGSESIIEALAAEKLRLIPRLVPDEVLSGLAGAMHSSNMRIRLAALDAFGTLARLTRNSAPIRSGMSWMIEALRRGNPLEQSAAANAAARAFEDCGVAAARFADPDGSLCAEMGNVLIDTVNSRNPQVRRAAMTALGALRYPNASEALADQLSFYQRGPDAMAALEGLAGIGRGTSADIFKRSFTDRDADMRRLAVEGLARSGTLADLPDVEQLKSEERSKAMLLALQFASLKLGATEGLDQLVAALQDTNLRPLALRYLMDLSRSNAAGVAAALQNPDAATRESIADVLGFSRSTQVIPLLTTASTSDPDAAVRAAAQRAIARINLGL
jgi:HEAT repeat protein